MLRALLQSRLFLLRLFLVGLMLLAAPAWGEEEGKKEGQDAPAQIGAAEVCPCTFGPLITDTAVPIEKGKFAIQPQFALGFTGGTFDANWRRRRAGGDFLSFLMPVKFTYGLAKNLETFVVVPYVHNWARNVNEPGPGGERASSFGGLGDINLTLKYQLLEESEFRPMVTGLLAVNFPTGHHHRLNPRFFGTDDLGAGGFVFTAGFNVSKWVKPFILYGNLWYSQAAESRVRGDGGYERERGRDFLTLNLAVEYPIGGKGPWVLLLEYNSFFEMGPLIGGRCTTQPAARMGILPGIEYIVSDKLAFALGVSIDLAGKNTDIGYMPIFSFTYVF